MKKEFLGSLVVHFVIIIFVVLLSSTTARVKGYPTVYRVNLVSLPKASSVTAAEVKTIKAKDRGVAFKPIKKPAKKEISPDKQVLEDLKKEKAEKPTADESKSREGIGSAVLEGKGLENSYYVDLMLQKIKESWRNPVKGGLLKATVYFKILRNGEIINAEIEVPSGVSIFDQSAIRAVISASPLPPLPSQFTSEYLGVHLEFEYTP
jgi:TonB family protein